MAVASLAHSDPSAVTSFFFLGEGGHSQSFESDTFSCNFRNNSRGVCRWPHHQTQKRNQRPDSKEVKVRKSWVLILHCVPAVRESDRLANLHICSGEGNCLYAFKNIDLFRRENIGHRAGFVGYISK